MRERRGGYSERNSTRPRQHRMQGKAPGTPRNRLADETSPYLAAARRESRGLVSLGRGGARAARASDKPILLSIGYSACHWCHVMAHESFEDPATAARDERAVREHQGRSRGAARPRQDLPDRAPGADAARRRLAAHDVPHAGRPHAVLRRHLFSERAALRHAGVHGPARARRRVLPRRSATSVAHAERQRCAASSRDLTPPAASRQRSARRARRSTARASSSPPRSTRASAASATRRSSRIPLRSSCCCATGVRPRQRGARSAGAVHGDADAARAWPKAASTTSSAAASAATRSIRTG